MKQRTALSLLLLCLLLVLGAQADTGPEAQDISNQVSFQAGSRQQNLTRLTDRIYSSYWAGSKGKSTLTIKSTQPMHGLYICWRQQPQAFTIQQQVAGGWEPLSHIEASTMVHQYYALSGQQSIRLVPDKDDGKHFSISELFVLGEGSLPPWVQRWQPTVADADLMLLFAHPDDEVLFFGGTLPYYAGERGMQVLPVCLTDAGELRRHELLNSLWTVGVKHYPIIGPFKDLYARDLQEAYRKVATLRKSNDFITGIIRQYKPEVIVSHDVRGEYGHGVHMLCAERALKGVINAVNPEISPASYEQYGGFQVQKLYLHLYKEKGRNVELVMDWDQPLASFGGRTGYDMAAEAYQHHLSQHRYQQFKVEPRDSRYSSYHFGLAFSTVGDDVAKDDFFEHVSLPGAQ